MTNTSIKRYLISSGITFVTAFLIAILPLVQGLDADSFSKSAVVALALTGLRAGIKALIEFIQFSLR